MKTTCPKCDTRFRVTDEILAIADGQVRCGRCKEVFDARKYASRNEPQKKTKQAEEYTPAPEYAGILFEVIQEDEPDVDEDDVPSVLMEDIREQQQAERGGFHVVTWTLGILLLLVTLTIQTGYFYRDKLSQYPELRPYLEILCNYTECKLPLINDIQRGLDTVKLLHSEVNPDPQNNTRLIVKATIVNTAPYTQAFPLLEVALTNHRDKTISMRRFKPEEYLLDPHQPVSGIQSNEPVNIILQVVKPETPVSGFRFRLL